MNKYFKSFLLRGLTFAGFGPIIFAIVICILSQTKQNVELNGTQLLLAIVSTYLLAFFQAGASVFNQIESWPITKSMLFHFSTIYIAYVLCYIVNSWIPFEITIVLFFTLIFVLTYFIIWAVVYLSIKAAEKKLNHSLKKVM